jgi:hypothetical protein
VLRIPWVSTGRERTPVFRTGNAWDLRLGGKGFMVSVGSSGLVGIYCVNESKLKIEFLR